MGMVQDIYAVGVVSKLSKDVHEASDSTQVRAS
ncbi:hypothetical protein GEI7407_2963 [Geitlerinema sp. PCC 7407]|nr:hypothetical protein GEI7407_2963 [Geitlerinema sp. PCC 7407]